MGRLFTGGVVCGWGGSRVAGFGWGGWRTDLTTFGCGLLQADLECKQLGLGYRWGVDSGARGVKTAGIAFPKT